MSDLKRSSQVNVYGFNACAGLLLAAARATQSCERLLAASTSTPVEAPERPEPPAPPQTKGCGVTTPDRRYGGVSIHTPKAQGSVEYDIIARLTAAELAKLTADSLTWGTGLEHLAAEYEERCQAADDLYRRQNAESIAYLRSLVPAPEVQPETAEDDETVDRPVMLSDVRRVIAAVQEAAGI